MQEAVTTPLAEGSKGKAGKVREKLLGPTLSWGLQSWKRRRPLAPGPRAPEENYSSATHRNHQPWKTQGREKERGSKT